MITSKGKLVLIYFTNLHRIMGQRRFRMTSFYLVDLEQEKNTKEGGRLRGREHYWHHWNI